MKKIIGILILFISILLIYQNIKLDNNADNDNVYFAFYDGNKKLDTMPLKDNGDGLLFSHGECDNGASIVWNEDEWAPLVKSLSKSKTKCSLYFRQPSGIEFIKNMASLESGDGLYKVEHNNLEELGSEWDKTEYRYAGVNPNNYVSFNNEIWRVIGVVNAKTNYGIEQRIKIVRTNGVREQNNFGNYAWDTSTDYTNDWTTSTLKDMLNGIYYDSSIGECYTGNITSTASQNICDFSSGTNLPKGLDETSRNMIDKDVIWNLGGWSTSQITANQFYEKERGIIVYNNISTEWNSTTDVGGKYNGIGLIYPSDLGYAVGGDVRNDCLAKNLYAYDTNNCNANDWLKPDINSGYMWTLSPNSSGLDSAFYVSSSAFFFSRIISCSYGVMPVVYLKSTVKILPNPNSNQEYGSIDNPFILQ